MSYKILVIDHDPDDVERVRGLLSEAGYTVVVASEAAEALAVFEGEQPDLTLIEVLMPGTRGSELCKALKNSAVGAGHPIVLVSNAGEEDQEVLLQVAQSGCDQVLEKPIAGERLLDVCRQLLPGQERPEEDALLDDVQSALGQLDALDEADVPLLNTSEASIDRPEVVPEVQSTELVATKTTEAVAPGKPEDLSFIYEDGPTPSEQVSVNQKPQTQPEPSRTAPPSTKPESSPAPVGSGDKGEDIEAHLDSLFGGAPAEPPTPPPASPAPDAASEPAPPQATKPDDSDIFKRAHEMIFPDGEEPTPPKDRPQARPQPEDDLTLELDEDTKVRQASPPAAAAPTPAPAAAHAQTEAFGQPAAVTEPTPRETVEPSTGMRGSWLWLLAAAVAVVVIGAGYFAFFSGSSDEPTPRVADGSLSSARTPDPATIATPPPVVPPANSTDGATADAAEPKAPETSSASGTSAAKSPGPLTTQTPRPVEPLKPAAPKATAEKQTRAPAPRPSSSQPVKTAAAPKQPAIPPAQDRDAGVASPAAKSTTTTSPKPAVSEPRAETPKLAPAGESPAAVAGTVSKPAATPSAPVESPVEESATPDSPTEASSGPSVKPSTENVQPAPAAPAFTEPIAINRVEPTYPAKALKKGERGTVVLKVLVSEQGSIVRVLVEEGIPGSELEAAAISAVLRWKYQPATENGKPVKAWAKARFVFEK